MDDEILKKWSMIKIVISDEQFYFSGSSKFQKMQFYD
jgi:hypothetical protein